MTNISIKIKVKVSVPDTYRNSGVKKTGRETRAGKQNKKVEKNQKGYRQ
jgi:hypothetical protein